MKYRFNEPFAETFAENEGKSTFLRFALAMRAEAEFFPITFPEKSCLPTVSCFIPDTAFIHPWNEGVRFDKESFDKKINENPSLRDGLFELKDKMNGYCTYPNWLKCRTEEYVRFSDAIVCWGGSWIGHSNPDYGKILRLGTDGIRKEIEKYRKINPGKDEFYDGCEIVLQAFETVCRNIRKTALNESLNEKDEQRRNELLKIADVFNRVPAEPCYDMYSAVMCFWAEFTVQGADSPGNFDRYMYEFFKTASYEENICLIDRLLEGFQERRSWNLCISGSDENFNDTTNELSYMILDRVAKKGYNTPNLTMRVHPGTPEKLWDAAVECIATGIGLPSLYNDTVVCASLEKLGIPPEDSHLYCMNGCNQIDIFGKSHMGLEDGEVNLGKVLELTLHGGYDMLYDEPKKVTDSLGDVCECKSFDEFVDLYLKYQNLATDVTVEAANRSTELYKKIAPYPLRCCLFEGCLEKGRDFKDSGPVYGHGQILLEGIADTVDSLYAVKKLIFDEKKYTMRQLINALEMNFEHFDDLYFDFKNQPKFGNDIDEVDEIAGKIVNHFNKYLNTKQCVRGGVFSGGCSTFNRSADRGIHTSALPNGKKKGEDLFADSIAATPGNDKNGPTASINSCLKYDQTLATSGFVTQMKFSKSLFNTVKGREAFKLIAKSYFKRGGQNLSVNVVDRDALLDAQIHPEKYGGLIVRVGGFSEYFVRLDSDLQQNIIERTEFAV